MALFTVPDIQISGLSVCVPAQTEDNMDLDLLTESERGMFVRTIGIRYRRIAPQGVTAADLCLQAANKLVDKLNWNREEIQALIFVTQTPDYIIPNTSSLLQDKLGLSKNCLVFDINLGCSGYVYGLSVVGGLLRNIPSGKALLLVGDVSTSTISRTDRSTWPLFSDAGSATALEYKSGATMHFNLQTDGKEYEDIMVPDGGFRNRTNKESFKVKEWEPGIRRSRLDMKLDGVKIFNFALREIAPNINDLLKYAHTDTGDIDYFVFHQANLLMLESLRKKLKLAPEKVPYSLYDYGNSSSATIPLTLAVCLSHKLRAEKVRLLLSGFGVGLSWGSVLLETDFITCLPIAQL